jgi:hypothetical protein
VSVIKTAERDIYTVCIYDEIPHINLLHTSAYIYHVQAGKLGLFCNMCQFSWQIVAVLGVGPSISLNFGFDSAIVSGY